MSQENQKYKAKISDHKTVNMYLNDIRTTKPLSREEEIQHIKRIKQGSDYLRNQFIEANLRFVVSVVFKYQHKGLPLPDLINEGNLGLIHAVETFNETRGVKFISHAVWKIRQMAMKALNEKPRLVRPSANAIALRLKLDRYIIPRLEQKIQRYPLPEEVCEEFTKYQNTIYAEQFKDKYGRYPGLKELEGEKEGKEKITLDRVKRAMDVHDTQPSLDSPLDDEDNSTLMDILVDESVDISPDSRLEEESFDIHQEEVLRVLDPKSRDIIKMYNGIDYDREYTLKEIGKKYKISRERARQIKRDAVEKMRKLYINPEKLEKRLLEIRETPGMLKPTPSKIGRPKKQ